MDPTELLDTFLQDAWDATAQFGAALAELPGGDPQALSRLALLAHRLKGSAALYGYPQTARLAALAERLLEGRPELPPGGRSLLEAVLSRVLLCLRGALANLGAGQPEGELGLSFAQVGGPEALRALLAAHPAAFRPSRSADPAAAERAAPQTLEAELRAFRRENEDVWEYFAPEVREHLDTLRAGLEAGSGPERLSELFRAAHTVKGSAYVVGFGALGDLAHRLEDLMSRLRAGELAFSARAAEVLQHGVALAERLLRVAEGEGGDPTADLAHLSRRVAALLDGEPEPQPLAPEETAPVPAPAAPARQTVRVGVDRLDRLMDLVAELVSARARLNGAAARLEGLLSTLESSHARVQRVVRDFEERYLNPDMVRAGEERPQEETSGLRRTVSELFAELEFDSYDDLNILARAVTELSADLGELRGQFAEGVSGLQGETEALAKLSRNLRAELSRARRVPVAQALTRVRRWVRGQPGLTLAVSGEEQEVDAHVAEGLSEALLHLATNALVHGLESPEERLALGKPATGRLAIRARTRGHLLEVEVADDGRGLDLAAVRERALAAGLRSGRELAAMPDGEAARLIFLPGLSTAREVGALAGRGVGLDVVAAGVRRLGGEVQVESRRGQGTTFRLRLPLTQQVAEVLNLRVGPHPLGLLTTGVRGLLETSVQELAHADSGPCLPDGTPLVTLHELWGEPLDPQARLSVVVTDTAQGPLALAVSAFGTIEEGVISPPGSLLGALGYLSGSTLNAAGEVVPLLDPAGLRRLAGREDLVVSASRPAASGPSGARVLLVDDSLSVRRSVARMLERGGYRVESAHDGQAALETLRGDPDFALVLTDLEMPRLSGFELIEELRRRPQTAGLPIAVMTTRAGEKHQQLAFALGASDYFSKPVEETLLLRRLHELTHPARAATP